MNNNLIRQEDAVQALYERSQSFTVSMFATSSECNVARIVALECASIIKNMPTVEMGVEHGNDLISRSALLNGFDVCKVTEYDESGCGVNYLAVPVDAIKQAAAVDAVEVVRCRDCTL